MFGVNNKQNKVEQFWCHFEDEQQQQKIITTSSNFIEIVTFYGF